MELRPFAFRDCEFESRRWRGCLSRLCVACCRSPCDGPIPRPELSYRVCVSLSVIGCYNNFLYLQRAGRRGQTEKERKKEERIERRKEERKKERINDFISHWFIIILYSCKTSIERKGKGLPQQAEVAQGVPGRLRPRKT